MTSSWTLIWRSITCGWNLRVWDLQMICGDQDSNPSNGYLDPFHQHGLTYITAWINNHMPKKCRKNNHPFPNCPVEVWEWISNLIHLTIHMNVSSYLSNCLVIIRLVHIIKRGHSYVNDYDITATTNISLLVCSRVQRECVCDITPQRPGWRHDFCQTNNPIHQPYHPRHNSCAQPSPQTHQTESLQARQHIHSPKPS